MTSPSHGAQITAEALTELRDTITPGVWHVEIRDDELTEYTQIYVCSPETVCDVTVVATIGQWAGIPLHRKKSDARAIALTPTLIADLLTARSQIEALEKEISGALEMVEFGNRMEKRYDAALKSAHAERDAALARVRVLEEALITIRDKRQQCNRAVDCQAVARAALNQEVGG